MTKPQAGLQLHRHAGAQLAPWIQPPPGRRALSLWFLAIGVLMSGGTSPPLG